MVALVERRRDEGSLTGSLLAPLAVGAADGQPEWLVVIDVIGLDRCVVRYPDGATEVLVDSA